MPEIRSYSDILMFLDDQPRTYAEGEVIFEEGQSGLEMFIVREGTVVLKRGDSVLEKLGPGSVFGEMALIDPAPRSASAVAGAPLTVAAVDERMFQQLVQHVPGFALELMRLVVRRLRREMTR
jgi:CRP/FNR family cyclic AMP-dependent transcriptional regulator